MKNKLSDLNNHLFAEIERLSEEDLKGEELKKEIDRANALACVAKEIVAGGSLILKAHKAMGDGMLGANKKLPEMLTE